MKLLWNERQSLSNSIPLKEQNKSELMHTSWKILRQLFHTDLNRSNGTYLHFFAKWMIERKVYQFDIVWRLNCLMLSSAWHRNCRCRHCLLLLLLSKSSQIPKFAPKRITFDHRKHHGTMRRSNVFGRVWAYAHGKWTHEVLTNWENAIKSI